MAELCGRPVVPDPVGREVVLGIPVGAGNGEPHSDRRDAGPGVRVEAEHAIGVGDPEPLVAVCRAPEGAGVIGYP